MLPVGSSILKAVRQYPFWPLLYAYRRRIFIGLGALALVDLMNMALPLAIREGVDAVPEKNLHRLYWAGGLVIAIFLVQSVMRYLWRIYLVGTSNYIARGLRQDLYRHLQTLPLPYYQKVHTGDLMSRATNDIEAIREAVGPGVLVTVDAFFMFLFVVPAMFWLSPKLTLLTFAFFPLVPYLTYKVGSRIDVLFESTQKRMSTLSSFTQEHFAAIRLVKSLVLENKTRQKFLELSQDYTSESMKLASYQSFFSPALSWITYAGTALILVFGGHEVLQGTLSVGTFVAFQRFVVQISWPMEAIAWAVTMNREGFAAHRRFQEILTVAPVNDVHASSEALIEEKALLSIPHLVFTYPTPGPFELKVENLKIHPSEKLGIVGPIGCGKTTLFNLIMRLYEPAPGSVYFEGKDVLTVPLSELRQRIATVEQQVRLFSESVSDNITMGLGEEVEPGTIQLTSQRAMIDQEIAYLRDGYQTLLGERGVNLSGGQKQRVALSRALIRKPHLLLLDDAFSAVDVQVEKRIIENLFREHPEMGFLVASHRLSIMPYLDSIWVMDGGKIVAKGKHAELLQTSPLYQNLWAERKKIPVVPPPEQAPSL